MDKGKGSSNPEWTYPDPRNWGNVDLSKEELELYKQNATFESYYNEQMRKLTKEKVKRKKSRRPDKGRHPTPETDVSRSENVGNEKSRNVRMFTAEVHPVLQIPENSYLGAVFKQVKNSGKHDDKRRD